MIHESERLHEKVTWCLARCLQRRGLGIFCLALLMTPPVLASKVRLLNLEDMVFRADRIVSGRCVGTRTEIDKNSGHEAMFVTLHVDLLLKGYAPATLTYKTQPLPGVLTGRENGIDDFGCHAGDELILLLYGESAEGFSSPVGLGQGQFIVSSDKLGRRVARNKMGNEGLLRGLSVAAQRSLRALVAPAEGPGELSPDQLVDLIQAVRVSRPHAAGQVETP